MPSNFFRKLAAGFLLLAAVPFLSHAGSNNKKEKPKSTDSYLDEYLKRARAMNPATPDTAGSLWVATSPYSVLTKDYKARNVGDTIVVNIADTFTAATNGENSQARQFTANSSVTNLLGKLSTSNALQNLLNGSSGNTLDGKGASTMSSNVSLNLSAQVIEVLPNGVLVVQASRDITLGNDRQTVVLRGLVRPGDLSMSNTISSASIANLEVEVKGKGAVAEASHQPNIIVRTLLKLFTF